jgi:hypothetical protein
LNGLIIAVTNFMITFSWNPAGPYRPAAYQIEPVR